MVESLAGYFHSRQHIPFLRMQELFRDIFSVPISEGGIHCLLNRLSAKALPLYHRIRDMVINSPVVGTDEIGGRLSGKRYGYGPGRMSGSLGCGAQTTGDTKLLERVFPKVLQIPFWYTIAGEVIFKQVFKLISFAQLTCSGNSIISKNGTIIAGLSGLESSSLMVLN